MGFVVRYPPKCKVCGDGFFLRIKFGHCNKYSSIACVFSPVYSSLCSRLLCILHNYLMTINVI